MQAYELDTPTLRVNAGTEETPSGTATGFVTQKIELVWRRAFRRYEMYCGGYVDYRPVQYLVAVVIARSNSQDRPGARSCDPARELGRKV